MQVPFRTAFLIALSAGASAQTPGLRATPPPNGPTAQFVNQPVQLQPTTPGTPQVGNVNVTGALIAGSLAGSGAALTNLNASQVASGTLADARLSSNVAKLNGTQTFTGGKTFSSSALFTAAGAAFSVANSIKIVDLNCDKLDGLDSSAFLQSIPVPLVLVNPGNDSVAIEGTANNGVFAVGVRGVSDNGTGVWGESSNSVGVWGNSFQSNGVVGASYNAAAIYGSGLSTTAPGVWGANWSGATAAGVYGSSLGGTGVQGDGALNGVQGITTNGSASGVYGENNGNGFGVAGRSPGSGVGVYGESGASGYGVVSNGDGWMQYDLYVSGAKVGYVADIVRNVGNESLECGDLVEIVGTSEPVLGEIPVIDVRKATSDAPRAVLGPIASALSVEASTLKAPARADGTQVEQAGENASAIHRIAGSVQPGAYASVVTLGSFKALKVDAGYGAIRPGDLLVASPNPGFAMLGIDAPTGTVIGKSLGTLAGGTGSVPVLVNQQ